MIIAILTLILFVCYFGGFALFCYSFTEEEEELKKHPSHDYRNDI